MEGEVEKTVVLGHLGGTFKYFSSKKLSQIDEGVRVDLYYFLIGNNDID